VERLDSEWLTDAALAQSTIGREAELGTIGRFVDAVDQGCGALIVEGEPGIGKTTLWREGLRRARGNAYRVLICRAGPVEAQLPFAALGDLFEPVDEAIGALPRPQAHGLAVALLKIEPDEGPPDPLTISVAGLGVLRHLACSGPVLVAIDNVHWVDAASYRVLEFALRRLVDEPVGVLLTRRPRDGHQDPFSLGTVLSGERVERLMVGPLSENDMGDLLRARLGASFPRRIVARIHELCRGNPFFALEVAMGVQRAAHDGEPDEDLRISSDLQGLLLERVEGLPADSGRAMLIVASAAHATLTLLERTMGAAGARAGVDRCVELGILDVNGDRLRFSHPLIGSAVYAAALPGEKRAVHELLATACSEPEESARHLALAASGPDASVADTVGRAATVVRDRGAPELAAGLCELARRLTPAERLDDRSRRTIDAVDCLLLAGNFSRAQRVIHEACPARSLERRTDRVRSSQPPVPAGPVPVPASRRFDR
jgi:AAA ATPase domain